MGRPMIRAGSTAIGSALREQLVCSGFCIALAVSALMASVSAEPVPALKRVRGVEPSDTLNVRAEPSAASEDIGDLEPGAAIEVLDFSSDQAWARIVWEEGNGWVAKRYLEDLTRPRLSSGLPLGLSCSGTEPFWSLQLDASGALAYQAGDEENQTDISWSAVSRNAGDTRYAFGGSVLEGVLRREQCTDGMSDRDYGWSLDLLIRRDTTQLLSGCCTAH